MPPIEIGGPEMAPHTPPRSARPGGAVARLDDATRLSDHTGLRRGVHRAAVTEGEPAFRDAVDEPEPDHAERHPCDEDAHSERDHDEDDAQRHPQQPEPERADLPAEVRVEPCPARLAALDVVQDHRDERRPAEEKGADHGGRANDADQQAERVQTVDDVGQLDQRGVRLNDVEDGSGGDHAPSIAARQSRFTRGNTSAVSTASSTSATPLVPRATLTPKSEASAPICSWPMGARPIATTQAPPARPRSAGGTPSWRRLCANRSARAPAAFTSVRTSSTPAKPTRCGAAPSTIRLSQIG